MSVALLAMILVIPRTQISLSYYMLKNMNDIPEIDTHEAQARVANGAFFLDVREQNEYDNAHIVGIDLLIPLGELTQRYAEIPHDREIVVTCRSGGRSARATQFLLEQGYNATNMAGGILAWHRENLPIEPEDAVLS